MNADTITLKEAAKRLKKHPRTIRAWLNKGSLRGTQPAGRKGDWLIPVSEIERMQAGQSK